MMEAHKNYKIKTRWPLLYNKEDSEKGSVDRLNTNNISAGWLKVFSRRRTVQDSKVGFFGLVQYFT